MDLDNTREPQKTQNMLDTLIKIVCVVCVCGTTCSKKLESILIQFGTLVLGCQSSSEYDGRQNCLNHFEIAVVKNYQTKVCSKW